MKHDHDWGTIERGRIYCDATGCTASRPIADAQAVDFIYGAGDTPEFLAASSISS